jgi:hypothetical protein
MVRFAKSLSLIFPGLCYVTVSISDSTEWNGGPTWYTMPEFAWRNYKNREEAQEYWCLDRLYKWTPSKY